MCVCACVFAEAFLVCVCVYSLMHASNRDTAGIKMQLSRNRKEAQGERRPGASCQCTDPKQAFNIPHPWECRSWPGIVKACPACGAEISLNLASDSGREPRLLWVEEIWFSAAMPQKLRVSCFHLLSRSIRLKCPCK